MEKILKMCDIKNCTFFIFLNEWYHSRVVTNDEGKKTN